MTKTIYLFTVFVLLSASALQSQTPRRMTIEELFRLAETQNSDIGAAGQAVDVARQQEKVAAVCLAAKLFLIEPFVDMQNAANQRNRTRKPTFFAVCSPKSEIPATFCSRNPPNRACNSVYWKPPKTSVAVLKRVTG